MDLRIEDKGPAVSPPQGTRPVPEQKEAPPGLYCPSEVSILVIDDDVTVCKLIGHVLRQPNFIIDMVSAPAEIEPKLRSKRYDLVVLDYMIPGIKPEGMFEWLRRDQPEASIIVVSGYPSVDSVISCLRARTYDYFTKPLDITQFEEVVSQCLEIKGLLRLTESALRERLGGAIRERRKALGLTLAQMADRTNISLGYLSQIELGRYSASIETLYRICLSLGLKMSALFQLIRN